MAFFKSLHVILITQPWPLLIMFVLQATSDAVSFTNSAAKVSSPISQNTIASIPIFSKGPNQPGSLSRTIQGRVPVLLQPRCVPFTQIPAPPLQSFIEPEHQPGGIGASPTMLQTLANPRQVSSGIRVGVSATVPLNQANPTQPPPIQSANAPEPGTLTDPAQTGVPSVLSRRFNAADLSSNSSLNLSSPQLQSLFPQDPVYSSNPYIWQYPGNGPKRTSEGMQCSTTWDSSYSSWLQVQSPVMTSSSANIQHGDVPRDGVVIEGLTRNYRRIPYIDPQYGTFTFTPSGACCLQCWVKGRNVQVHHWPTPAPVSPFTQLVKDGYTFTSPSIYLRFESLHATDFCGDMFLQGSAVTIPFAPDELSTTVGYTWDTQRFTVDPILVTGDLSFTKATWGKQENCSNKTESFWQIHYSSEKYSEFSQLPSAWTEYYDSNNCGTVEIKKENYDHYTITHNPCSPSLAVPTRILSLNSLWSDCGPGISGFYDPPTALEPRNGFTVAADPLVDSPNQLAGGAPEPSPGAAPAPAAASATAESEHKPTPTNVAAPGSAVGGIEPAPSPNGDSSPNGAPGSSPLRPGVVNDPNHPNGPQPPSDAHPSPAKDPVPINPINGLQPPTNAHPVDGPQGFVPMNPINGLPPPKNLRPGENPPPPAPINGVQAANSPALATNPPSPDTIPKYTFGDGSQTLAPGSVATISGTVISLQPGGSNVVFDGKTIALDSYLGAAGLKSGASIVVGGKTEKLDVTSGTNPKTSLSGKAGGNGTILIESGSGVLMDRGIWISGVIVAGITAVIVLL